MPLFERKALGDQGARGEYPDVTPQAIRLIDAEGRSCIYVPTTEDGKAVDSQSYVLGPEDGGGR